MKKWGWVGVFILALVGCSTRPPLEEYTLAFTAINAAKQYESDRYAPGLWFQAEENYRKGQVAYKEEEFEIARDFFIKSKQFAEKSENKARAERGKRGGK